MELGGRVKDGVEPQDSSISEGCVVAALPNR